jgi:hypothetical protein
LLAKTIDLPGSPGRSNQLSYGPKSKALLQKPSTFPARRDTLTS